MRASRIFTLTISAVCLLVTLAAPAAAHEFYGQSPFTLEAISTTPQTFRLGTSGTLICEKLRISYNAPTGSYTKLTLTPKEYAKCTYSHFGSTPLEAFVEPATGCEFVLKSAFLHETSANDFNEGTLGTCSLHFETRYCEGKIIGHSPLSEYEWNNLKTTGTYESELIFNLSGFSYEQECGENGTNGAYEGGIRLQDVIVK